MVKLLGFEITRKDDDLEKPAKAKQAFTIPSPDDGTTTISAGGYFGQYLDMEVTAKNDFDLIKRYREISQHPECDTAIEDIINEVIISNERDSAVSLSLDKLAISENIKTKIRAEFDEVLRLLNLEEFEGILIYLSNSRFCRWVWQRVPTARAVALHFVLSCMSAFERSERNDSEGVNVLMRPKVMCFDVMPMACFTNSW